MHVESPDGVLLPYGNAEIRIQNFSGQWHLTVTNLHGTRHIELYSGTLAQATKAFDNFVKGMEGKNASLIKQNDIVKGV